MGKKRIELEKLASELFLDISRANMSLTIRPNVMAPLFGNQQLVGQFNGFFSHLFDATAIHSFLLVARMFDEPDGRFQVTLEALVKRVVEEKAGHARVAEEAENFLKEIVAYRLKLALVRNTVFAHRVSYPGPLPDVKWADLGEGRDLAKRILGWYGSWFGHAYTYDVPGFEQDCRRFVEAQLKIAERRAVNSRGDRNQERPEK